MFRKIALLLVLCATVSTGLVQAQVPEGGAYEHEDVTVDWALLELLSNQEVLTQVQAATGRHGLKMSRITRSQQAMHVATYTFWFDTGRQGGRGLMTSANFNVDVSFGPLGAFLVGEVGQVSVAH